MLVRRVIESTNQKDSIDKSPANRRDQVPLARATIFSRRTHPLYPEGTRNVRADLPGGFLHLLVPLALAAHKEIVPFSSALSSARSERRIERNAPVFTESDRRIAPRIAPRAVNSHRTVFRSRAICKQMKIRAPIGPDRITARGARCRINSGVSDTQFHPPPRTG